jgi:hypothetical protein
MLTFNWPKEHLRRPEAPRRILRVFLLICRNETRSLDDVPVQTAIGHAAETIAS